MLKSAESGHTRAQNNVGLYFKHGTGTQPDLKSAVKWLQEAATVSTHVIFFFPNQVVYFSSIVDFVLCVKTHFFISPYFQSGYPKLAKKTLAEAREELGQETYAEGLDLFGKKNFALASKRWQESATLGYSKAMCDLGWMYSQEYKGMPKDPAAAFKWMLKAAEKGGFTW